jgi:hypothetical protein
MTGFIIAALIVGYFGVAIAWLWLSIEKDINFLLSFVVLGLWLALGLGFAIQSAIKEEESGPCLQWETSMIYNPATKMVQPARRCVERAEWVK